jgi:hypothetical protein
MRARLEPAGQSAAGERGQLFGGRAVPGPAVGRGLECSMRVIDTAYIPRRALGTSLDIAYIPRRALGLP